MKKRGNGSYDNMKDIQTMKWNDDSVADFFMFSRQRPDIGKDTFECAECCAHPDRDGSVLFIHKIITLKDYFMNEQLCLVPGRETDDLKYILKGYGYESIQDLLEEWDAYEECLIYDNAPGWEMLACMICGSHYMEGMKLTQEEACRTLNELTNSAYDIDDFSNLGFNGFDYIKKLDI